MIVRPRPRFFELLFLLKGSILPRIASQLIAVFLFSIAMVVLLNRVTPQGVAGVYLRLLVEGFRTAPFTLLGIAISIFLGFRNNACYDRWWEARRQLGQMVGEMRSLARLANTTLAEPGPAVRAAIAFTYTLHARLRQRPVPPEAAMYLSADDLAATAMSRNPADHILQAIARKAAHGLRAGQISDIVYTAFDARLAAIANIQVACERIATTPTPYTYTLLLHRTAYLFCFLLPVSLAPTMGVATPVFCTLIAYTFFGLDALGDELEDPFGEHANTLPLDALARIIEINLLESLGQSELPPYLEPVEYVLR